MAFSNNESQPTPPISGTCTPLKSSRCLLGPLVMWAAGYIYSLPYWQHFLPYLLSGNGGRSCGVTQKTDSSAETAVDKSHRSVQGNGKITFFYVFSSVDLTQQKITAVCCLDDSRKLRETGGKQACCEQAHLRGLALYCSTQPSYFAEKVA